MYNFEILQNIFEEYFKPGLDIYKECKITSFEAKKGTTCTHVADYTDP